MPVQSVVPHYNGQTKELKLRVEIDLNDLLTDQEKEKALRARDRALDWEDEKNSNIDNAVNKLNNPDLLWLISNMRMSGNT